MHALPVKFESILKNDKLTNFAPLILRVDSDLAHFSRLAKFNRAQDAGTLAVISSPPGSGKTTAAYAATVLLRERFLPVLTVPPPQALPLRGVPSWLHENLPPKSDRTTVVLVDGRESTDDDQGLRDLMSSLNQIVRGRPDLLFVWPTTADDWRDMLVGTARTFGSTSLCPERAVFSVTGPGKAQWVDVVTLVLEQFESNWDELNVNVSVAEELAKTSRTLGDFLTALNEIRVEQDDLADSVSGLPEIVFVVSSHSPVVGHVARLRNPRTYRIRSDEIIQSAPNQEVANFWKDRGLRQQANLAWVSSQFGVKLVALTPSTIAHACYVYSPADSSMRAAIDATGFRGSKGPGSIAYRKTDLGRFMAGEPVPEVLASNKGKTAATTLAAFDAIQALSSRQHLAINRAVLQLAADASGIFKYEDVDFEKPLGGDAIVDAIVPLIDRRVHLEFHHLSGRNLSPNRIATYMMKKLRVYATQYNLIER